MESIQSFDVKEKLYDSVVEVFDTMLSMELDFEEKVAQQYMFGSRFLGSINLVGKVMGIVTIQVSEELSRIMTSEMLGIEWWEIESNDEIKDVIGEVLNMISGGLKSSLCDAGLTCNLSTPAITSGKDYVLETSEMTRNDYFTFYFQDHVILVQVGLKDQDLDAAAEKQPLESEAVNTELDLAEFQVDDSIQNAITEVFDTMLDIELAASGKELDKKPNQKWIVGSVSLSGIVMGRVNIHIPEIFSHEITAAMLDMDISDIEDFETVKDCVGEVCNMVSGHLKTKLCDTGMTCQLSPPSFTSGMDFEMDFMQLQLIERFGFQHLDHKILVEVGLKRSND